MSEKNNSGRAERAFVKRHHRGRPSCCLWCGHKLKTPNDGVERTVKCSKCHRTTTVNYLLRG